MDDDPGKDKWTDLREGRSSRRSRRQTYLLLFTRKGRPRWWLIVLALVAAVQIAVALYEAFRTP